MPSLTILWPRKDDRLAMFSMLWPSCERNKRNFSDPKCESSECSKGTFRSSESRVELLGSLLVRMTRQVFVSLNETLTVHPLPQVTRQVLLQCTCATWTVSGQGLSKVILGGWPREQVQVRERPAFESWVCSWPSRGPSVISLLLHPVLLHYSEGGTGGLITVLFLLLPGVR